ncbi:MULTISPECIES: PTS IIA-like nitrogen regulatory protein PtsN [Haemophilus]|uniref:PTS IIA-like nitrogen-regulatory protein PtsN n=2 Tax=Haemophilus TaxID=724 RepID=A0A502LGL9_HAEHA|nr:MULTISPECIES: PTS IIA-like nitrogen regulatory protein PtsN [Haemophilus]KAA5522704.1 PTS IIA-like nitrogen regulatory protein PtsN [Haemophilus seminalis]OBX90129.1 PTS IIA-like nitrogen-regulatory protein PtsN [Haemophilus sp. CCUG 66565]TPH23382.1 PTS IIA-like nitrogen-regulatory protein PtsN [Haemophilus haemolyticus]
MNITELLSPENIRQGVSFSSKKRLFESIAHFVIEQVNDEKGEQVCLECLFEREKLGNSGLGNGIAMPKAKIPVTLSDKAIAVFMQLDTPIDYDSSDGKFVDLVFAVLVPENQCVTYMPILSFLTERLTDKNLLKQLRSAKSAEEIWQVFEISDSSENISFENNG